MKETSIVFANDVKSNKTIETTISKIIASRVLWEGDSGSGKSHGMCDMIQKTDNVAQRIVIDLEGEYFPLKNHFKFLLVGKSTEIVKADVEINLNDVYVEKLAQKLLEKSVDTIIDLSEVPNEAVHFVSILFKAILRYSKMLKRPLLIFLDEAQHYAPEKGTGKEESLKAVKDIAKRGRKRGIGLICGTQAIADFSKDVVRQLRTRFIGNCTYDKDVKAACDYLGFERSRESELRELAESHYFFVAGPAVLINGERPKEILKIKATENKTKLFDFDFSKTIKLKEKDPNAIKELASEFSDIPQIIDKELSEKELLRKENIELRKKLNETAKIQVTQIDTSLLQKAEQRGLEKGKNETENFYTRKLQELKIRYDKLTVNLSKIPKLAEQITLASLITDGIDFNIKRNIEEKPKSIIVAHGLGSDVGSLKVENISNYSNEEIKLRDGAIRMLKVVAQMNPKPVSRNMLKLLSEIGNASTFSTYITELKKLEYLIEDLSGIKITELGLQNAGSIEPLPTSPEQLLEAWARKFREGGAKMLRELYAVHPNSLTKNELMEKTGITNQSTFSTYITELKTCGLVVNSGNSFSLSNDFFGG